MIEVSGGWGTSPGGALRVCLAVSRSSRLGMARSSWKACGSRPRIVYGSRGGGRIPAKEIPIQEHRSGILSFRRGKTLLRECRNDLPETSLHLAPPGSGSDVVREVRIGGSGDGWVDFARIARQVSNLAEGALSDDSLSRPSAIA